MRPRVLAYCAAVCVLVAAAACQRVAPLVVRPDGPPPPTLIRRVAIFDGVAPARTPPRDVLLEGGRVRRIAPAGTVAVPAGGRSIEGVGLTLLPGLIDVHGHLGDSSDPPWKSGLPDPNRNMQRYLYAGVTTVLDPQDLASEAFARRDAVAAGELLGPRIYAAGPMFTAPGGHPVVAIRMLVSWWLRWYVMARAARQLATPAAGRAAVAALAPLRPDVIKVAVDAVPLGAPIIDAATLRAVVEEARAHGIRTVAHVGTTADALAAAAAGVAAWMHGVYKERIPDDVIPRFAAAKIPCVATVTVFDSYADLAEGRREATALEREVVSARVLDAFLPVPPEYAHSPMAPLFRLMADARQARRDNVARLHAAGVTILAGADAQPGVIHGAGLHRELATLVEAGLTPAAALRAATGDAARFVSNAADPEFGIVAEGKIADLLLVEGDPTTTIGDVSRIRAVFQAGVELQRFPVSN